jgi:hypothetical protein
MARAWSTSGTYSSTRSCRWRETRAAGRRSLPAQAVGQAPLRKRYCSPPLRPERGARLTITDYRRPWLRRESGGSSTHSGWPDRQPAHPGTSPPPATAQSAQNTIAAGPAAPGASARPAAPLSWQPQPPPFCRLHKPHDREAGAPHPHQGQPGHPTSQPQWLLPY